MSRVTRRAEEFEMIQYSRCPDERDDGNRLKMKIFPQRASLGGSDYGEAFAMLYMNVAIAAHNNRNISNLLDETTECC